STGIWPDALCTSRQARSVMSFRRGGKPMPETLVLCGGEGSSRRYRGKLVELDLAFDAPDHKKIDFQSEQICAGLLDDLPDIVADALEIAVYVYSADRLLRRGTRVASSAIGPEWQRKLRFRIPVRC